VRKGRVASIPDIMVRRIPIVIIAELRIITICPRVTIVLSRYRDTNLLLDQLLNTFSYNTNVLLLFCYLTSSDVGIILIYKVAEQFSVLYSLKIELYIISNANHIVEQTKSHRSK
jgi:hypothetical protein